MKASSQEIGSYRSLLLPLAANHAATAFQSARLVQERERAEQELRDARNELELKVAERTAELHVANEALARLAQEQAALRRVATLVARGVRPVEIFSAVSEEVGHLFGTNTAGILRFEHDRPTVVFVGVSKNVEDVIPIGTRLPLDDALASARVRHSGHSARVDATDWSSVGGSAALAGLRLGLVSTVACPIVVEGSLWGTAVVSADEPLAPDAEERLEKFAELVATAISNAEGKTELAVSRRRIVAASDEARRRIERDLHDGTQQLAGRWRWRCAAQRPASLPTGRTFGTDCPASRPG